MGTSNGVSGAFLLTAARKGKNPRGGRTGWLASQPPREGEDNEINKFDPKGVPFETVRAI